MTTNRLALALAVAGGYALGRTKKGKMAIGLATLLLGRRFDLNPQHLLGTLGEQLKSNPQLAGVGEELRGDLKGVGKAATDALITRQMNHLADSLHGRTEAVRDRIGAAARKTAGGEEAEGEPRAEEEAGEEEEAAAGAEEPEEREEAEEPEEREEEERPRQAKAERPEKRPPAKKAQPAKKAAAVKKTAAAKPTAARKAAARKPGQPVHSTPRRGPGGGGHG